MNNFEEDTRALQQLEDEERALENRPHNGYQDAARVARLRSEIEAIEERILRDKQRAEQGQG